MAVGTMEGNLNYADATDWGGDCLRMGSAERAFKRFELLR